ncbi:MAG: hypothetical protein FLDDKLPJ_00167 [Phycisphaerae bacterium]|nr:hypothetical protein [Phycisphaerae bacterium]
MQRIAADNVSGTDATTLHTAEYDALGRRIEKVVSHAGDLDGTFRYGYNGQQMIEMRDGSGDVLMQAYYGTQYIDEIVALKLEHGYAVVSQDANYNVTTLTDLAGRVLERVFYTEYGQPIIQSASYFGDYDADGDVDSTDDGFLGSGQTCWGTATGTCRVFDFNGDGTLDAADETIMTAIVATPSTNRVHHARRSSPAGNLFLHQGLVYDAEIGAYQNRAREYASPIQRFQQRDRLGYVDALSSYQYVGLDPISNKDPFGLAGAGSLNPAALLEYVLTLLDMGAITAAEAVKMLAAAFGTAAAAKIIADHLGRPVPVPPLPGPIPPTPPGSGGSGSGSGNGGPGAPTANPPVVRPLDPAIPICRVEPIPIEDVSDPDLDWCSFQGWDNPASRNCVYLCFDLGGQPQWVLTGPDADGGCKGVIRNPYRR